MTWQRPERITRSGSYVVLAPLDPQQDIDDLYALSHQPPAYQALWTYLSSGPFATQEDMLNWLRAIQPEDDPLFFTVTSLAYSKKVGMISIMNSVPAMGRAELGNIWYSPLVQRSMVNTETVYLLLAYLFDELGYRRVEWKCDNNNSPSKTTAQRMGFVTEGLFRQHMLVKGRNRDTAWFSMIDSEWPVRKANFTRYLYGEPGLSLTQMNSLSR